MQKFSTSTLQKAKRTTDEARATVAELQNVVRVFSRLSSASNQHIHGFELTLMLDTATTCFRLLKLILKHPSMKSS